MLRRGVLVLRGVVLCCEGWCWCCEGLCTHRPHAHTRISAHSSPPTTPCSTTHQPTHSLTSTNPREKHVAEAREWASNLDLRAENVREACLSFPSKTLPWNLWARSSDNVLSSWQYQLSHFRNCWSCWARKWREQNYRNLAHNISPPCAWYQHTLVNGMSSLHDQRYSALTAHVARAVGIELAHSEGQYVIHFLWDMRKFYNSIKAHLLIPQLVARGCPLELLVFGSLTHESPRCLQVGNGYSDVITGCASSTLAGCLQSCSWARGLWFELVQALGYVVPGSVCEEHIDDLSQFVANTCRIQLFHDAALIGKAVKEGTAKLGLILSGKSTLLANDRSLALGDEGVPICSGTSATDFRWLGSSRQFNDCVSFGLCP